MASVTLVESAKLSQDMLITGVIEDVITVNQFYQVLPFDNIEGNAIGYNRENALGDVQAAGVGTTITAKNPATFTYITSSLTTIIGDAEVNGLIQATRSNKQDQTAIQISSKAKNAGMTFQNWLINGTGAGNQFNGLLNLCAPSQRVATGAAGGALSFQFMDELLALVTAKNGQVDYMQMPIRTINSYKALLRALGGVPMQEVYELPSGKDVIAYSGVPIFRNDYIPTNQVKGGGTNQTTIFAGCLDDGTRTNGLAGLTATEASGLEVEYVGVHQSRDEKIWRVKWYCGLALFSEKALASADGITN